MFSSTPPSFLTPITTTPTGLVTKASHSALQMFEKCEHSVFIRYVQKFKPASNEYAQRGINVHELIENVIRGQIDEIPSEEFVFHHNEIYRLRDIFAKDPALIEMEKAWYFDSDWGTVGSYDECNWQVKTDVTHFESEYSVSIKDWKTGKKFGNELKHGKQQLEYALSAFMRFPEATAVDTTWYYLDNGQKLEKTFFRKEVQFLLPRLNARLNKFWNASDFAPNPSIQNCKYCPYSTNGVCKFSPYPTEEQPND